MTIEEYMDALCEAQMHLEAAHDMVLDAVYAGDVRGIDLLCVEIANFSDGTRGFEVAVLGTIHGHYERIASTDLSLRKTAEDVRARWLAACKEDKQ